MFETGHLLRIYYCVCINYSRLQHRCHTTRYTYGSSIHPNPFACIYPIAYVYGYPNFNKNTYLNINGYTLAHHNIYAHQHAHAHYHPYTHTPSYGQLHYRGAAPT
jgi:hypothetical protein